MPDNCKELKAGASIEGSAARFSLSSNLNSKYTFDTFVVGTSNQFAYKFARAVADDPARVYNPLLIYGSYGLGKTHLLHAIGNHILARNKKASVVYCTSEIFMTDMINCLRAKKMEQFRDFFRGVDILLLDDVQFFAGKEATQEELFHSFDALYAAHKQIVMTSGILPRNIPHLEESLRSRFAWGLSAEIQPPDTESKLAIIKQKAEAAKIHLPEDVARFLASCSSRDIRELEGWLVRLEACSNLLNVPITKEMTAKCLQDVLSVSENAV